MFYANKDTEHKKILQIFVVFFHLISFDNVMILKLNTHL